MHSLTIPQHRDPVARAALIVCGVALVWLAFAGVPSAPQTATAADPIILIATPTVALPTLAPIGAAAAPTAPPPPTDAPPPATEPPAPTVEEHGAPIAQADAQADDPAPCYHAERDLFIRAPLPVAHLTADSCISQDDADAQLDAEIAAAISAAIPLPMQVPDGAPTAAIAVAVPLTPLVLSPPSVRGAPPEPPVGLQTIGGELVNVIAATPTP